MWDLLPGVRMRLGTVGRKRCKKARTAVCHFDSAPLTAVARARTDAWGDL